MDWPKRARTVNWESGVLTLSLIHISSLYQKSLAEFVPTDTKHVKFVFSRDTCVDENTSHPASVEFGCYRQTNYTHSRVQPFRKSVHHFFNSLRSKASPLHWAQPGFPERCVMGGSAC